MVYYVTDNLQYDNVTETDELKILSKEIGLAKCKSYLIDITLTTNSFWLDLETTGLEPYINDILLCIVGDKDNQFVLDVTYQEIFDLLEGFQNYTIGNHNLKFDLSFLKTKCNLWFPNLYDIMIAEGRIYQGSGLSIGLASIAQRHLGHIPEHMDKSITESFINMKRSQGFNQNQIMYSAWDIKFLPDIRLSQEKLIQQYNMEFLVYEIEFPLVLPLIECELEGLILNKDKWKELIKKNRERRYELECLMDEEIRRLRDKLFSTENNKPLQYYQLVGGKFSRQRPKYTEQHQTNLFAIDCDVEQVEHDSGNINYGSTDQILDIFARFEHPICTKDNLYLVPYFAKGKKIEKHKGIANGNKFTTEGFTTNADFLNIYILERPDSYMIQFMKYLIEYRETCNAIDSFGTNFFDKINPITSKIHSIYRQAHASTSRLQSGGGKKQTDKINNQNIPAKIEVRECFGTDFGYNIVTCDLSGAELITLCDKANDLKLLELSKADMHSYFANKCWSNIYKSRGLVWTDDMIISKTNHKEKRTLFKNITFAVIYGAYAGKVAKMLNITKEEGQIVINTLKSEIPNTFQFVEGCTRTVLGDVQWIDNLKTRKYNKSFIVLDQRTNARMWYLPVANAIKSGSQLDYKIESEMEGSLRNGSIQGTQANMIKEAIVEIYKTIQGQKLDAKMVLTVHDEIAYKYKQGTTVTVMNPIGMLEMPFAEFVCEMMKQVANRYLTNVRMGAEYHDGLTWTK